tara:strand:+ start:298 stop:831 length:534 start_codon:yes stop_codon:yes gene_type:complete
MSELRTNRIVPRDGIPSGSNGGIVQVKYVMSDTQQDFGNTSNTYQSITGLSLSFTPVRADSIIHVRTTFNVHVYTNQSWDEAFASFRLFDNTNSTTLNESAVTNRWGNSSNMGRIQCDVTMDAFVPASNTGARTYVAEAKTEQSGYYVIVSPDYGYSSGGSRAINTKGHIYAYEISS